jgi:uncharacterized phiE125 gp8 family phage protein
MAMRRTIEPTQLPISLAEAKAHLRVEHSYEDALITSYIQGATDYVDGYNGFLGRALVDQTWQLTLDEFPDNEIKLPLAPVIAVSALNYDAPDGNQQTLSPTLYTVDAESEPGWILPAGDWPDTFDGINSVRIVFRAGYINTGNSPVSGTIPGNIRAALLLYIGALYDNRQETIVGQAATQLPWNAEFLLRRHRIEVSLA